MKYSRLNTTLKTMLILMAFFFPLVGAAKDKQLIQPKIKAFKIKKKSERLYNMPTAKKWLDKHFSNSPVRNVEQSQKYFPFVPLTDGKTSLVSTICDGIGQPIVALYGTAPTGYKWTPATRLVTYNYEGQKLFKLNLEETLAAISNEKDFASAHILHALAKGDMVYVSLSHNTYAKATKGKNAFIQAYNLKGEWLWNSDFLVSNSKNFLVFDDHLISGYGFTAELDYLFQLNRHSGKTLMKYKLVNGPDWFAHKAPGVLHILTYDRDITLQLTQ